MKISTLRIAATRVALAMILMVTFAMPRATAQVQSNDRQNTTLYIAISVERTELTAGPYARYAQKHLGVAAPLADKVTHKITSVNVFTDSDIAPFDYSPYMQTGVDNVLYHMSPDSGFARLTVDKTSAAAQSPEENARTAAQKIFDIRRSRFDLITGNVGENVFGGGLTGALAELNRLEEEYLSLFFGRQISRTEVKKYHVTPVAGSLTYTVCRFSEAGGAVAQSDLSGEPVVLELRYATGEEPTPPMSKPSSRAVPVTEPSAMDCHVVFGGAELTTELVQVQQLGRTVYVSQ